MAFGIGLEAELVNEYKRKNNKKQKPIACDCWFTSTGKTMPRKIKFEDEEGVIQTIENIEIRYTEKCSYSGIISFEYLCSIPVQGFRIEVKLLYYPERSQWMMEY